MSLPAILAVRRSRRTCSSARTIWHMKLAHVGVTVSNLERSTDFYSRGFGYEPFFRIRRTDAWLRQVLGYPDGDLEFQHLRGPDGSHLELIRYWAPEGSQRSEETYRPGHMHFCLYVQDIRGAVERAVSAGARVVTEPWPARINNGPNEGTLVVYLRGPDGETIELSEKP